MTPTEIIRMIAQEFAPVVNEDLDKWLELAEPSVSKKRFGNTYEQALALMTCHKMKMVGLGDNTSSGTIGDTLRVGSYSEGETSIGYTVNQGTNLLADAELTLTAYGLQFLSLRRSRIIPIISAGEA